MTQNGSTDDGFTLVETVIAMLIMAVAVVTIVSALGVMIAFNAEHRAHAVVEVDSRSFGQAVQAQAQATTTLTGSLPDNDASVQLQVEDASLLPPGGSSTGTPEAFLLVGREVMQIDDVNRADNSVAVVRSRGGLRSAHAPGTAVSTFLRCPGPEQLTPAVTPAVSPHHLGSASKAEVTSVGYWRSSGAGNGSFVGWTECDNDFKSICPGDVRPECTTGFMRVILKITIPDDERLNKHDMQTTTAVLVRRGSA